MTALTQHNRRHILPAKDFHPASHSTGRAFNGNTVIQASATDTKLPMSAGPIEAIGAILPPMKAIWTIPLFFLACSPMDQEIVGRFDRNAEAGCQSCVTRGPLWMEFDEPSPTGSAGRYRFQFEDEQRHSGTYQFLSLDTNVTLTLFPDSSTVLYSDLIGEAIYTEYTARSGAVREPCEGLFRNCRWDRQP